MAARTGDFRLTGITTASAISPRPPKPAWPSSNPSSLPHQTTATKWSLQGNFLIIRGDLRTYKIHLGSGNILMEPNDQYLCIVPDRSTRSADAGENLFLPFEGDSTLSVILSKAFLLAEDSKIKDPTITRQIG